MSQLETKAEPILTPMIGGKARTLTFDQVPVVATWAMKFAMMLEYLSPATVRIPESHYRFVYRYQQPPLGCALWLGKYSAEHRWSHYHSLRFEDRLNNTGELFAITLAIHHLVFYFIGHRSIFKGEFQMTGVFEPTLRRLWPWVGPVEWPPPKELDTELLNALSDIAWLADQYDPRKGKPQGT